MALDMSKYTVKTAKPMPVILLLDVSGSMAGSSIDELNSAVSEMLKSFTRIEVMLQISIITFGNEVKLIMQQQEARDALNNWQDLDASGMTPLGTALRLAKDMIEDKEIIPSRSYRPLVVLVSDGEPTDDWRTPLQEFVSTGRSQKSDRMAMGIGVDFNRDILSQFIAGSSQLEVFTAADASQIKDFFKMVTMSVTRSTTGGGRKPDSSSDPAPSGDNRATATTKAATTQSQPHSQESPASKSEPQSIFEDYFG